MRGWVVATFVILAMACTPAPRTPNKANPRLRVTPLEVIVLDDFPIEPSCRGVAPRKIHVALDGVVKGTAVVPCREVVASPPPQFPIPAFEVPPGPHVVAATEPETETTAVVTVTFPVFAPPLGEAEDDEVRALATKMPVWASELELEIHAPRTTVTM
ncbi:MAG: hypothetical protein KF773_12505 [Deltaproteobacteria bacterium]|nr:hypothetical protein [Deltaproteobacteria bacterium]